MTHEKKDTTHSMEHVRLDRLFARCGSPLRLSTPEDSRKSPSESLRIFEEIVRKARYLRSSIEDPEHLEDYAISVEYKHEELLRREAFSQFGGIIDLDISRKCITVCGVRVVFVEAFSGKPGA